MAALSRMANRDHQIRIVQGDTVILASSLIPGNENAVYRVINGLTRWGANVVHKGNAKVHVSGHASAGELLYFYNICKPKNLMPVHGEWRHLRANAELGALTGVPQGPHRHRRGRRRRRPRRRQGQDRRQGPGRLRVRRRPLGRRRHARPPSRTAASSATRASSRSSSWWTAPPARSPAVRTSRPAAPASTTRPSPPSCRRSRKSLEQVGPGRRRRAPPDPAADPPLDGQVGLRHLPPAPDDPAGRRRGLTPRQRREPGAGPSICIGAPRSSTFTAPPDREPGALVRRRPPRRGREFRLRTSDKVGSAERQRPLQRPPESNSDRKRNEKESGKVGTAGKGNAKAKTWKANARGNRTRKSLIESETQDRRETPGGKPERVSTKEASVP